MPWDPWAGELSLAAVNDIGVFSGRFRLVETGEGGALWLPFSNDAPSLSRPVDSLTPVIFLSSRNLEADVAFRSTAAVYTYCRSRGLFVGISLEGSYLIERKETNRKYASTPLRSKLR